MASYNEKLLYNILIELGVPFIKEFQFEGSKKRYDFLIENVGIVELHGGQHYNRTRSGHWKSYEEEHENDLYKYDLAVLHGYEYGITYYIIDCSSSNHEQVYNNICDMLKDFIPICSLNKTEIMKKAEQDLTKIYCDYWEKNNHPTPKTMGLYFDVNTCTIVTHLKNGSKLGLCNYSPSLARKEQGARMLGEKHPMYGREHCEVTKQKMSQAKIKYNSFKRLDEEGNITIIPNDRELIKEMGYNYNNIVRCCKGERKSHKGYRWEVHD